jgi:hypothetical protein
MTSFFGLRFIFGVKNRIWRGGCADTGSNDAGQFRTLLYS